MSLVSTESRFAATLPLPTGPHRFIDLRAAAQDELATLPWCLRVLLENALADKRAGRWRGRPRRDPSIRRQRGRGRDPVPAAPDPDARHDLRAGPGRHRRDAGRDRRAWRRSGLAEPDLPGCHLDRPFGRRRPLRHQRCACRQHADRGRPQCRALPVHEVGASDLGNFRVFPPGTGIMHTINMEHLTPVVAFDTIDGEPWVLPDTLLGTDSHTPMINAVGVLGWGVGGLEAEGAMFGLPLALRLPEVVGVRLTGSLRPGRARHRCRADRDRAAAQARAWSASSSSSSGRASRAWAWASAGRSPTWRRNTAPRPASSRSTAGSSTICARPAATTASCRRSRPMPASRASGTSRT